MTYLPNKYVFFILISYMNQHDKSFSSPIVTLISDIVILIEELMAR